jgi:putative membrane protein
MRYMKLVLAGAALALLPSALAAQTTTTTPSTSSQSNTQQPPVAGANSFTEAQAKDRIEKAGYAEVTGLKKDDQGIWRASAKQGDKQVNVALDFQGNVVANP